MDLASAALAAIALSAMAIFLAKRVERRASALSAAGLNNGKAALPRRRPRFFPALAACLTRLGEKISPQPGDEIRKLVEESGSNWTPHYLQGLRLGSGLSLSAFALTLGTAALPLAPFLFALGYQAPMMALKRKRARRFGRIASDLPEIVDLMAVLCYSGESVIMSFRHAVSACSNPCSREEMERVLERMRLGESASGALRSVAGHPCREMRRFSRTLIRAEEFGSPIADTLEELAVELRNARREKDRVRAARVSVLILLPLVFLILPSFLLLTVGGMILGYTL
jgi:Flp pilus assembly protein TadB